MNHKTYHTTDPVETTETRAVAALVAFLVATVIKVPNIVQNR